MKFFNYTLKSFGIVGMLLLSGCVSESPWSSEKAKDGKIELTLVADNTVNIGTRADDETSPYIPNVKEFTINLRSKDGSLNNSWGSLDSFNSEDGFAMGNYILSASFGSMDDEGFRKPYFYGETTVSVTVGNTSTTSITATLANSMFSVRYTDKFKEFFPSYSATVQTTGHNPVVFEQRETEPAYLSVGNATLNLNLTNEEGKSVTVAPSTFTTKAKTHTIVTVGVEGNINQGQSTLTVEFSEEVDEESVEISIDELFNTEPPRIDQKGYSDNKVEVFESIDYLDINPEFHVFAFGKLAKANLTIATNDGNLPAFLKAAEEVISSDAKIGTIDLLQADPSTQSVIESSGLVCDGFFGQLGDMAILNFKNFIKKLNPGTYTIMFDVEDNVKRSASLEIPLTVTVEGIKFDISKIEQPDFLDKEVIVNVITNCEAAKQQFKFKSLNSDGQLVEIKAEYLGEGETASSISDMTYASKYKLTVNEIDDWMWTVAAALGDKEYKEQSFEVNMPEFTVETDAFARKVWFKVKDDTNENLKNYIINKGKIFKGNDELLNATLIDKENGIFEISEGIQPDTQYSDYTLSLGKSLYAKYSGNINFKSEKDTDLDFQTTYNLVVETINVGGQYETRVGFIASHQQIKSSINIIEPSGDWATLNEFTCYSGSTNKNTWYMEPSTFWDENDIIVRSVGYNHQGPDIPESKNGTSRIYYGQNVPDENSIFSSIGELFLGSYSYSGSGNGDRVDGIAFDTRPSSLNFEYSYRSVNGEQGIAVIKIYNDNNIIAQNSANLSNTVNKIPISIPLTGYSFAKGATKIEISFKSANVSGDPAIERPLSLDEGFTDLTYLANAKKNANDYVTYASGSELRISNVHLEY